MSSGMPKCGAKKRQWVAERPEQLLHVLARSGGHRLGRGVGREQRRAGRVDPSVGRLRGDHGDHEALEGVGEVELGPGVADAHPDVVEGLGINPH